MAEIDIEKKNGNKKVWLWVIILLIAAALIYWWYEANNDEGLEEVETEEVGDETVMKDDLTARWQQEVQNS